MTHRRSRYSSLILCLLLLPVFAAAQPLEGEEKREAWYRVPEIAAAMGVKGGSVVADVGAGYGFLTVRLAALVGKQGKVYAVDTADDPLKMLRQRAKDAPLSNIEVIEGTADDPRLPSGALDAVVVVDAYHEMTEHEAMLTAIRRALKPGGRSKSQ